jgi:hypothetical protein
MTGVWDLILLRGLIYTKFGFTVLLTAFEAFIDANLD